MILKKIEIVISEKMLMEITEKALFQDRYALVDDILIDFNNGLLYKIYKLTTGEELNRVPNLLNITDGGIMIVKTQNYMAKIFNENYSQFIFKQFENEDFLSKTQEELTKRSKAIYGEFKQLEDLYKDFSNEIRQRITSLTVKRVSYFLLPLKITVSQKIINETRNKYLKEKQEYFKKYDKFAQNIDKTNFVTYMAKMEEFKNQNQKIEKSILYSIVLPSIELENAESSGLIELTTKNVEKINDFETQIKPMILKGTGEASGIFDSLFYDEVFLGDKYYNVMTFFNEQISALKYGEKYFSMMKKIIKNINHYEIYNNRILLSSGTNNMLYFVGSAKNIIGKNENLIQLIDEVSDNFDFIIKFQKVDKNEIVSYIDESINSSKLKITSIIGKERESKEVLESTRKGIKEQQDYYISLKNKILDTNENVYAVSGYFVKKLLLKNQESTLQDFVKMKGLDIRQTVPGKKELEMMLDMKNDLYGFFIHTRPMIHYINPFQNFKNIGIVNTQDSNMMMTIQMNSV